MPVTKWSAQYQQDPTSEQGAIIKENGGMSGEGREGTLPLVILLFSLGDTAFLKTQRSDFFGVYDMGCVVQRRSQ